MALEMGTRLLLRAFGITDEQIKQMQDALNNPDTVEHAGNLLRDIASVPATLRAIQGDLARISHKLGINENGENADETKQIQEQR